MMVLTAYLLCGIFGLFVSGTVTFATTNLFRNGIESSLQRHLLSLITQASHVTEFTHVEKDHLPAGYIYVKLSNGRADKVCAKAAVTAGLPVNTCIGGGVSSYKMQLLTDSCSGAVVEVYNDGNCSSREPTVVSLEPYADQCTPYTGEHDITLGGVTVTVPLYFWTLSCTAQPSKPIPVASVALELYSDTNACDNYLGYVGVAPDLCLPVNNGLASIALKCSKTGAINLIQYFGGACGFVIGSTPYVVNTCVAASYALPKGYGRTINSASFSEVALKIPQSTEQLPHSSLRATPSVKTSHISQTHTLINEKPTEEDIVAELTLAMSAAGTEVASFIASCAQPNTNYAAIILVSQVLRAVDISSFLANEAANYLVLQKTIASCLAASTIINSASALPAGSVRWSDVFITSALPVIGTAVVVGDLVETQSTPLPSLAVTYTVLSYHAGVSNTKLASALQQSVESGVFVDLLHQTAASEGATALLVATSESLSGVDEGSGGGGGSGTEGDEPVVTSSEGNTPPSEKLSGAALIGTVVGGVFALLLVCAGLVYYFLAFNDNLRVFLIICLGDSS